MNLDQLANGGDLAADVPSRLAAGKTTLSQMQRFTGPTTTGSTVTLFTDTGAGVIRSLWLAAGSNFLSLDGRLQVFTDGNAAPDIDMDIGTLFLLHNEANSQAGGCSASTRHWHGESPGGAAIQTSGALRFPIFYTNGVTVKLLSPGGQAQTANGWYFECLYQKPPATSIPSMRLKSIGRSWAGGSLTARVLGGNVAPAAASTQALWDLVVTKPAWLVWVGFAEKGAGGNWSFLERDVQLTIDAEATPSIRSSGTEDFFQGGFYYGGTVGTTHAPGGGGWSSGVSVVTALNATGWTCNQGIDLLELCGGVLFNSECKADLLTEAAVTVAHTMTYVGLYYQSV